MTLLKALGIDKYTTSFKTWIRSKFIAKGNLKTINNKSIEGIGNIETEIFTPESAGSTNRNTTTESRVYKAFYDIQSDKFTISIGSEAKPVPLWHINKIMDLGEIVNITIVIGGKHIQSCIAKVTISPTTNVQFDYLDTHYTLTWNGDTQSWDVTKTPINSGADWNAAEGQEGHIKNRTHYLNYNDWHPGYIIVNNGTTPKKGRMELEDNKIYVIEHKALNDPYIIYTNTFNDNKTVIINSGSLEVYHVCSNRNHSIEIIDYVYDINKQDFNIKSERVGSGVTTNTLKQLNNAFIPDTIARVDNMPNFIGKGIGSLVQTKEVETFENQAPIAENPNEEISVDATGDNSTVLNGKSHAGAKRALAHGNRTIALGENSHTEGHCTQVIIYDEVANGYAAHAEGYGTVAAGTYSHAEGNKTVTIGANSHSEGADTFALGEASHVEGYFAYTGESSSAPVRPTIEDTPSGGESGGSGTTTTTTKKGTAAHAEGNYTIAEGSYSHAEGRQCDSIGEGSHAEGTETVTYADYSHTEGNKTKTHTNGIYSHAEGISTEVNAAGAHAEGLETVANAESSHAEGWACSTQGTAKASHAEGQNCHTYDIGSHAEGQNTKAYGAYSHVEGYETQSKAGTRGQHVEGRYNNVTDSMWILGCGYSADSAGGTVRKNAIEVTTDGDVFIKGIGGYFGHILEGNSLAMVISSLENRIAELEAKL